MKKLLLSALAIGAFTFSNAQEEINEVSVEETVNIIVEDQPSTNLAGQKVIGGSIGFGTDENAKVNGIETGIEVTAFNILPRIGYFLKDDLEIGAALGYSQRDGDDYKEEKYAISPYARKYWMPEARFMPFLQADVSLGWSKIDSGDSEFAWGANVRPGFMYRFSKKVAFDTTIGRIGYNDNGGDDNANYGVNLNLSNVNLGVVIFF